MRINRRRSAVCALKQPLFNNPITRTNHVLRVINATLVQQVDVASMKPAGYIVGSEIGINASIPVRK